MVSDKIKTHQKNERKNICAICDQEIEEKDLVYLPVEGEENICVHFSCYIEVQNKICCECGKPFTDQEPVYFCQQHKEYFHKTKGKCLEQHMKKHMPFEEGYYDALNNRIIIEKDEQGNG